MVYTDIATRTYDHGWRLDPIVRSLLDTDFYKLLMLQLIWRLHRDTHATFALINRTRSVRQEGADLARRQQLLRRGADVRASLPRLAEGFPATGI